MALITIVTGAYKPTYNWGGGPHCMENGPDLPIKDRDVPIKTGDFPSENGDFPVRKVSTLTLCCGDGISPIVWWNSSSGVHQLL